MSNRGFSLVELSIVLVILGLLTGGILAGQSLIRAAELRSVTTEYDKYITATQSFRDKYFAVPGDMTNATSFWGAAHATPATCLTTVGTGTQTCNGDGDGTVESAAAASQYGERATFWQHLASAGLIEGIYSGRVGAGGAQDCVLGTVCPRSKLSNAGWGAGWLASTFGGSGTAYAVDFGNYLVFGASAANSNPDAAVLRPEEAWNIDTKLDDGKPAYGKIIAHYWNNACSVADDGGSANNDLAASYKLTDTDLECALVFRKLF